MARRHTTRLPIIITEAVYARAALAAEIDGVSLGEYAEAALKASIALTERRDLEARYARHCREAAERRRIAPTRSEFFGTGTQSLPARRIGAAVPGTGGRGPAVLDKPDRNGPYQRPPSPKRPTQTGKHSG